MLIKRLLQSWLRPISKDHATHPGHDVRAARVQSVLDQGNQYRAQGDLQAALRTFESALELEKLPFLRDHDVSVLVWDMLDHLPIGYDVPWAVHAALFAYGVALLDNALLEPLAQACAEEGRDEFMLVIAPLKVVGGTGSPANPLAVF